MMPYLVIRAKPRGADSRQPDWRTASMLSGHMSRDVAERCAASLNAHQLFPALYLVCEPGQVRGHLRRKVVYP